jgi:hypothetical protein
MDEPLIRGVAPQMRDRADYLTLGGGAGGRSLGSIFLVHPVPKKTTRWRGLGVALQTQPCRSRREQNAPSIFPLPVTWSPLRLQRNSKNLLFSVVRIFPWLTPSVPILRTDLQKSSG